MIRHRGIPGWVYVDFLAALVSAFVALLFLALVQQKRYTVPPALRTPGVYAITMTTPNGDLNDVDVYVRTPDGGVVFYANSDAGLVHLEHDAIPGVTETVGGAKGERCDCERTVIRGIQPGRYAVSVQMYRQAQPGAEPVVVKLWRLIGADRMILRVRVTLSRQGQEAPAFQFTLNRDGSVGGFTKLPIYIAAKAWGPS